LFPLWVWIYCIIWWFIQDILKVLTLAALNKFNILPNLLADMTPYEKGAIDDANWGKTDAKAGHH